MNKTMYLLVLISFLLFGCDNNQTSKHGETLIKDRHIESTIPDNKNVEFVPDTTVSNKLVLNNYQSIENYFGNNSNFKLVERLRSSPVAIFNNKEKSQYLLAYQYEGGIKDAFSCFEIGRLSDLQEIYNVDITQTKMDEFYTESGLSLGQSIDDVVKIKGNIFTEAITKNEKTISYKIDDAKSDFLKRYSMPGYFLQITFDKSEKVKKIIFGFDYP